jgi:uncharacterized membrane protein YsdA (DUF1294 family)
MENVISGGLVEFLQSPAHILLYAAAINGLTLLLFWFDKQAARRGDRRTPENTLFLLSLLGGSPAGWFAMFAFRHKTRKLPFLITMGVITALQTAGLASLALPPSS